MSTQPQDPRELLSPAAPEQLPPPAPLAPRPTGGLSIVTILIVVNVIVFVLQLRSEQLSKSINEFGAMQSAAVFQGQVWRLITSQYIHAGVMHLLVNMLSLHFLGRPLEAIYSRGKFLAVYTACGAVANLFFAVLAWRGVIHPLMPAMGASGSIYGLLGIVAVLFPHADLLMFYIIPVSIRSAALIMGVLAFMAVVERGKNYGGQAAHLAGLAFGLWWAIHGDKWWSETKWAWQK